MMTKQGANDCDCPCHSEWFFTLCPNGCGCNSKNEHLTCDQVAEYTGLSRTTVYKYARDGRIPSVHGRAPYWFKMSVIDTWLKAYRNVPRLQPCGTPAAYRRHLARGEETDQACRDAWRVQTERFRRKKDAR